MADHLTIDLDRVRQVSLKLAAMRAELDATEQVARDSLPLVGSGHLAHELNEFASNWRYHRQKLSAELDGFSKWAKAAVDGFHGLDTALAKALDEGEPKGVDW